MPVEPSHIRNFSIIAHIDHGKSTLADRLLMATGVLTAREFQPQFLDKMDIERERGITIKAQTVRLPYTAADGQTYQLNLIDTPGHVDFTYEVSKSLQACEGALLVIDASQGVEAQTLANVYLATEAGLEVIPVINKIDLPSADVDRVRRQIEEVIGLDARGAILASAKEGTGISEILEAVVERVPSPRGDPGAPLRALVFDSWYDDYRGAVVLVRVKDGALRRGARIQLMSNRRELDVQEIGCFSPHATVLEEMTVGEVGYLITGLKSVQEVKIGDTVTDARAPAPQALPGFKEVKPMVFAGVYPTDSAQYEPLRDALSKLQLNDSAFVYSPDTSEALGFGFRCGFLGLLHLEVIQERLEREYSLELITTAPSVVYHVHTHDKEMLEIENPARMPSPMKIDHIEEPYLTLTIHAPVEHIGAVLKLCEDRRGTQKGLVYAASDRAIITYEIPLNEVLYDFHDRLKSVSRGYASMDYEVIGYRPGELVRLDMLVNGEPVDALCAIVPKEHAFLRGRALTKKLREIVPRQMFDVAVQAAIGSRVIARETVKAMRKNVTAKCYGGDISRKRKLLERQKEGKKRMKQVGSVDIPQEAFLAILRLGDES